VSEVVTIGNATLYLGDCRDVLPTLGKVDAVITDPPYSERTHTGHDTGSCPADDGAARSALGYGALTADDVQGLSAAYVRCCDGWIVWMTDHTLAPSIGRELQAAGRYVFAPLPFFQAGRSVRLSGDGPSSWTDWIVVARTPAQHRWGTLPGGYVARPGWNDKARMGGKPTLLMDALVADYSRPGQTVLDSHMGAGTTGVSCVKSGRNFVGIEIDRAAFDIACERIARAQAQGSLLPVDQPAAQQLEIDA
jgi:site-specific DNA-methyltransferase (adenine-specific)